MATLESMDSRSLSRSAHRSAASSDRRAPVMAAKRRAIGAAGSTWRESASSSAAPRTLRTSSSPSAPGDRSRMVATGPDRPSRGKRPTILSYPPAGGARNPIPAASSRSLSAGSGWFRRRSGCSVPGAFFVGSWTGPLHILVNNAGIMAIPGFGCTPQGHESQFATYFLGHFALTTGLHPSLAGAAGARVVSVSSNGHLFSQVIFDDFDYLVRPYDPWSANGQSKTACILQAVEATRRWSADGIFADARHPGAIATNRQRFTAGCRLPSTCERPLPRALPRPCCWQHHHCWRALVPVTSKT
jgi:hypothetical protein